jgi:hypothetical protein
MEMQSAENAIAFAAGAQLLPERIVWLPGMAKPAVDLF